VLNLSGNLIADLSVADALSSCPKLRSLGLSRNAIAKIPQYRLIIASLLCKLDELDGHAVDRQAASRVTNAMILEAASMINLAQEEKEDEERMEGFIMDVSNAVSASNAGGDESFLGDTGSELTHGDNAVLAGNVAAAMRRRRMKSQLSNSTDSQNDLNESLVNPRNITRSSKESQSSNLEAYQDLSTIAVLDSALRLGRRNGDAAAPGEDISCFMEGDITLAVAAHYGVLQLEDIGASNGNFSPMVGALSATSPQVAKRPPSRASKAVIAKSVDIGCDRSQDGKVRGETGPLSNPRPNSAVRKQHIEYNASGRPVSRAGIDDLANVIDVATNSVNVSRNGGSRAGESKSNSRTSSFSDPGINRVINNDEFAPDMEAWMRVKSPYQHNSSRPQTSCNVLFGSLLASSDQSINSAAPFMVAAEESDKKSLKQLSTMTTFDVGDNGGCAALFKGYSKSIVHRDMVRPSGKSSSSQVESSDEEDEVDCTVFKSSFARSLFPPLSNSGSLSGRPPSGSGSGSRPESRSGSRPGSASRPASGSRPGSALKSAKLSAVNNSGGSEAGTETTSALAGASLGFNLMGSLAAIDQWVEAMDSDSDEKFIITSNRKHENNIGSRPELKSAVYGGDSENKAGTKVLSRDSILSMVGILMRIRFGVMRGRYVVV
jgi:hypothetical protein